VILANNFDILLGQATITVPWVEDGDDYQVVGELLLLSSFRSSILIFFDSIWRLGKLLTRIYDHRSLMGFLFLPSFTAHGLLNGPHPYMILLAHHDFFGQL